MQNKRAIRSASQACELDTRLNNGRRAANEIFGFDAFSSKEIAAKVDSIGVAKARLPLLSMLMLALSASAFIGLDALYFIVIKADPAMGLAACQVLGGVAFALEPILVAVAGAELFTGNNPLVMA